MKMKDEKNPEMESDLQDFEIELEERFSPVNPNPEFVDRLRKRLSTSQETELEIPNRILNLGIVLAILLAGLLLTAGLARLLYELLVLIGLIRSKRN
jgi:hypothetical protein